MAPRDLAALGAADAPYWRWLAEGELRLPRCAGCRCWLWPPQRRCATCGTYGLDWVPVEPAGTVYSWTRTWYRFVPEREPPFCVVLAEVDGTDGARVLGVLEGSDAGLAIGRRVIGQIHPASDESRGFPTLRWSLDGR